MSMDSMEHSLPIALHGLATETQAADEGEVGASTLGKWWK